VTETPLLEIEKVTAAYGAAPVVRGVSLAVKGGEVVALLGANGAGKSTLLAAASGYLKVSSGDVRLNGESLLTVSPRDITRRGLVTVPERRSTFSGLTVLEHFRLLGKGWESRMGEVLAYFPKLRDLQGRRGGQLSGGERQMLALACALARKPQFLLLDELSLGLAPIVVEQILPVVREFVDDSGCGILLVEQHVHLALEIADRGYVMSHGEITMHETGAQLRSNKDLLLASYMGEHA